MMSTTTIKKLMLYSLLITLIVPNFLVAKKKRHRPQEQAKSSVKATSPKKNKKNIALPHSPTKQNPADHFFHTFDAGINFHAAKQPAQDVVGQASTPTIPPPKKIRVLLEEHDASKETKLIIKSRHGFVLESPVGSNVTAVYQEGELKLLCKNKKLYLKCRDGQYHPIKGTNLEIRDPHQKLTLGSATYQGTITIHIDPKTNALLVTNTLPLEDYVYAVVRCEGLPSWPLEMQKIQAIISRTYAVFHIKHAQGYSSRYEYYDIKNTNFNQVYNGTHTCKRLRQAIEDTHDLIVTYKDKVALTEFDICCGGVIPGNMRTKDKSKPYLGRTQPCIYCQSCPSYRWKEDVSASSLLATLSRNENIHKKIKHLKSPLIDIQIIDRDKAGIVHKVKLVGSKGTSAIISGKDLYRVYTNRIKSHTFTLQKTRDRVVISGKGFGHQRGVCQWGCKTLVHNGWSIRKILGFYYPGTTLRKML